MNITPEQASELIRKRRSIYPKVYTNQPIPKEIIQEILEDGNWAPTHRMTEPWRFKVFQGEALAKLGEFLSGMYKKTVPAERFSETKFTKMLNKPSKCGAVIAVCMHRDEEERVPEIEEICAVACAVQNMWLSAAARDIGAYWGTPKFMLSSDTNAFLGLGEKDKCLGFFFMGYHQLPEIAGKRTPIEEKTEWM